MILNNGNYVNVSEWRMTERTLPYQTSRIPFFKPIRGVSLSASPTNFSKNRTFPMAPSREAYWPRFSTDQEEGQLEELIGTSDLRCGNVSVAITCEDEAQQNSHPYTWHCSVLIWRVFLSTILSFAFINRSRKIQIISDHLLLCIRSCVKYFLQGIEPIFINQVLECLCKPCIQQF